MGNSGGTKHDGEGAVLSLPAAIAFSIQAVEEQREKRELVGMHGEFAGNGVTQVRENGAALFAPGMDGTVEVSSAHARVACERGVSFGHGNSPGQK